MSIEDQKPFAIVSESEPKKEIDKRTDKIKEQIFERIPVAKITLSYSCDIEPSERLKISNSRDSAEIFRQLWNPDTFELQEHFGVLLLNNSNRVIGFYPLSVGGITSTVVDVRLIMIAALGVSAIGIIACHNHPSGTIYPSVSDRELTEKIRKAAEFLDLQFLDHIILTTENYFSFADHGEL